jgi:peptide/nickel transport system substrate-binding protein
MNQIRGYRAILFIGWIAWMIGIASMETVWGKEKTDLVIGVGRDFYDGPESRTFVHGSTNVWEALTCLDESLIARPWLAESWESDPENRTWIFRIRPGVQFHNGSVLTASDVVVNLERMKRNPRCDPSGLYRHVTTIRASGPNEVTIQLSESSPAFPNHLSYYSSPILHPSSFDAEGRIREPIGTGPYRVAKIEKGGTVYLERYPEYWRSRPWFIRVQFRNIPDPKARVMALVAGEIDAVADVGAILPEQANELAKWKHIVLKCREVATTHYLLFHAGRPSFSQAESRRWLANLIDRKSLVEAFADQAGKIAVDYYSPLATEWRFSCLTLEPGRKPDSSGSGLIILIHSGTIGRWPYLEIAQVIQSHLHVEGIAATVRVMEAGAWQNALRAGEWDLALQPNTLMTGDPDFFFSTYIASTAIHRLGYSDLDADQWIREARNCRDVQTRKNMYHRLCLHMNRQMPVLPLYHDICHYAHSTRLEDFEMDPSFRIRLDRIRPKEAPDGS